MARRGDLPTRVTIATRIKRLITILIIHRYETPVFQKKVKSIYEALSEEPLWQIVDADKTEEALNEELMRIVEGKIDNLELEMPAKMW